MRRSIRLLATLALAAAPVRAQTAPITVVVVRHAEKGPENPDPSLTPAGQRRAAALARALTDAHPTAIFASEFKRTQETVGPLAAANGIPVTIVPAGKMDSLLGLVRALPPGSHAVVASHSNLVHLIVQKLSGMRMPPLTDADYDRLVVVTITGNGTGDAVVLRYGESSDPAAPGMIKPPGW